MHALETQSQENTRDDRKNPNATPEAKVYASSSTNNMLSFVPFKEPQTFEKVTSSLTVVYMRSTAAGLIDGGLGYCWTGIFHFTEW